MSDCFTSNYIPFFPFCKTRGVNRIVSESERKEYFILHPFDMDICEWLESIDFLFLSVSVCAFTTLEPPDPPQDVKVTKVDGRSAQISWSPPYSGIVLSFSFFLCRQAKRKVHSFLFYPFRKFSHLKLYHSAQDWPVNFLWPNVLGKCLQWCE